MARALGRALRLARELGRALELALAMPRVRAPLWARVMEGE